MKQGNKRWHKENKEHVAEYHRKWNQENKGKTRAKTARRRAAKLNATPKWADKRAIEEFYKSCPLGYHVDHIIPLQHHSVCGLHVLENLQYLTASENRAKSNKWEM